MPRGRGEKKLKPKRLAWIENGELRVKYPSRPAEPLAQLLERLRTRRPRREGYLLSLNEWQDLMHHLAPRGRGRPADPEADWIKHKMRQDHAAGTTDKVQAEREHVSADAIRKRRRPNRN
jgi:hypothetical protein